METTYTIEFMRLAEPHLAPIKHPSAFHVAYYCIPCVPLMNLSGNGQIADLHSGAGLLPPWRSTVCRNLGQLGKENGSAMSDNSFLDISRFDVEVCLRADCPPSECQDPFCCP